jgi:uncharacterized protein YbjT (DUF2867 family)
MKILVLGATGGTGRLIVRDAVTKGHSVVALVRSMASAGLPDAGIMVLLQSPIYSACRNKKAS